MSGGARERPVVTGTAGFKEEMLSNGNLYILARVILFMLWYTFMMCVTPSNPPSNPALLFSSCRLHMSRCVRRSSSRGSTSAAGLDEKMHFLSIRAS